VICTHSNVTRAQKKYIVNRPDVHEGYLKIEGAWGSVVAGRVEVLFNRGAVVTDILYLHGYGVGFPADLNSNDGFPTAGQIGFGVLANGFAAGLSYSSPLVVGTQFSVGLYDPASLTDTDIERTKFPRPEFELTTDQQLGHLVRVLLYFNGGVQPNYQQSKSDRVVRNLFGIGYGTRIEFGKTFHLGIGGHWGRGLGLAYAGLPSDAVYDIDYNLRYTTGYFAMAQLVLGRVDFNGGYGRTNIQMTSLDLMPAPNNPFGDPAFSVLKSQTGVSAAVVFHPCDWLHFDIDVMLADSEWDLGERQRVNFYNAGTTITW